MTETHFAPAERDDRNSILEIYNILSSEPIFKTLMDKVEQNILILNDKRQAVYVNRTLMNNYGIGDAQIVLGLRPGEIFQCTNALTDGGCGTAVFCRECGAVNAILETQLKGEERIEECVITSADGETYELSVSSKPFEFRGMRYTLFSICDIGRQKRMNVLEQIFFHDIINIAGGIHSMLQLILEEKQAKEPEREKLNRLLMATSEQLINELCAHKTLKAAETNELLVSNSVFSSLDVLKEVVSVAENMKCSFGKVIYCDAGNTDFQINADESLLRRVLLNMLTNAIEASSIGDKVTVSVCCKGGIAVFAVHNKQVIPLEHRHLIFRKSFTTKKRGSGLGTHSIKLLTERYLHGRVDFHTDEENGTVFRVHIPIIL